MGLLLSHTHLRGENNSPQSAFYNDHFVKLSILCVRNADCRLQTGGRPVARFFYGEVQSNKETDQMSKSRGGGGGE